MRRIVSNKFIMKIFIGLTAFFVLGSLALMVRVSFNYRVSMIENPFIYGLALTSVALLYVVATIHSNQTNRINNVVRLKKYKWTVWLVSVSSTALLAYSSYQVFYNLLYTMFPQAIGFDQRAYWSANAPFIYLSGFAILLMLLANLMLLFIPVENR